MKRGAKRPALSDSDPNPADSIVSLAPLFGITLIFFFTENRYVYTLDFVFDLQSYNL